MTEKGNLPTPVRDVVRVATVRSNIVHSVTSFTVEDHMKLMQIAINKDSRFLSQIREHLKHEIQHLESSLKALSGGRYGQELSMSNEHRNKLRGCRVYICDELIPGPIFLYLIQDNILDDDLVEDIKQEGTRRKMSEKLLTILPLRGPRAYSSFIEALKKEQKYIAEKIELYNHER